MVGCLVDLATGLMTFTANGKEINTFFQVRRNNEVVCTSRVYVFQTRPERILGELCCTGSLSKRRCLVSG